MKVCFVMPTPFTKGGEQRVVSVVAGILQEKGYETTILCKDDKTPVDYELYHLNPNVKIRFMKKRTVLEKAWRVCCLALRKLNDKTGLFANHLSILKAINCDVSSRRLVREELEEHPYDVIIGVGGYFSMLIATVQPSYPIYKLGWQHNSFDAYFRKKDRYYWKEDTLFRALIPTLDKYIVLTKQDQKRFQEEWGISVTTIYNPKSFESKEVAAQENKVFLAAGRLDYAKGYDMLIQAFALFHQNNQEWILNIVGEGKEKEGLQDLIKQYHLQDCVFLKPYTNRIQDCFLDSSCLLLSSRWEGMPMIMLESFEMGVPVIAFDIPVVKELITDQVNGRVVKSFEIEAFAKTMEEVAQEQDILKQYGKQAKQKSEEFSFSKIGEQWDTLLKQIGKDTIKQ